MSADTFHPHSTSDEAALDDRCRHADNIRLRRRRRRLALASTIISVALASVILVATHKPGLQTLTFANPTLPAATGAGGPAPPLSLPDLRQPARRISLDQYRGRTVVVNFWASWCAPCRTEMPAFANLARQKARTVTFVGIDEEDSRNPALAFAATTGVTYPLASDPQATLTGRYRIVGFPTTVIISASGQILANHPGPLDTTSLRSLLAKALAASHHR
ncbi:MAG: TlpA family protein disulfide reductase [Actinomycetota bacterium]|nr:TlpA family protein disulfide reductase [Actinomycetota bacterium]